MVGLIKIIYSLNEFQRTDVFCLKNDTAELKMFSIFSCSDILILSWILIQKNC